MCYHAEFGCSRSNHVRISRGKPQNWHQLRPRRLKMEGVADHLKTSHSPMCYTASNLVVLLYSVVIDIKPANWGALELLPFGPGP